MFEQFFQNTGMFDQIRSNQIRIADTQNTQIPNESNSTPQIEKIDLGDTLLVMIDNLPDDASPTGRIVGRELRVILDDYSNEIPINLPFAIDGDKSSLYFQNGIVEITLVKSNDAEKSSDTIEHILRNE